jgi:hypothetical protein
MESYIIDIELGNTFVLTDKTVYVISLFKQYITKMFSPTPSFAQIQGYISDMSGLYLIC